MRHLLLCLLLVTPLGLRAEMYSINSRGTVKTPHEDTQAAVDYARGYIDNCQFDATTRTRMLELYDKATTADESPFLSPDEFDEFQILAQQSGGEHIIRLGHEVTGCIMQRTMRIYMHPFDAREAIEAVAADLDLERLRANGIIALGIAQWRGSVSGFHKVLGFHYVLDTTVELSEETAYVVGFGFGGAVRHAVPNDAGGFPFHGGGLFNFEPIFP